MSYYNQIEDLDSTLINYINENYIELSERSFDDIFGFDDDNITDFESKIILNNNINDVAIEKLIKVFDSYDDLDINSLAANKINYLIDGNIINLTPENVSYFFNKGASYSPRLIEKHVTEFIDNQSIYTINDFVVNQILQSDNISNLNKISILNTYEINSIRMDFLGDEIIKLFLVKEFELEKDEFNRLLNTSKSIQLRLKLLNKKLPDLSVKEIKNALISFGGDYEKLGNGNTQANLPENSDNLFLIEFLEKQEWVSKRIKSDKIKIYTKRSFQ
jgi:hypothetical protein